jgi:hypothetical protein
MTGVTGAVASGDLLFAGFSVYTSPITVTAGSSDGVAATLRTQFTGSNGTSADEDVTSTAAGPQDASFTLNSYSPGSWAACAAAFHKAPQVNGGQLSAVACSNPATCMAVGSESNADGLSVPLAERWNGTTWTVQSTPGPAGALDGSLLQGVSCASATECMAVGVYSTKRMASDGFWPFAERWNGTRWTLPERSQPDGVDSEQLGRGVLFVFDCLFRGRRRHHRDQRFRRGPASAHGALERHQLAGAEQSRSHRQFGRPAGWRVVQIFNRVHHGRRLQRRVRYWHVAG